MPAPWNRTDVQALVLYWRAGFSASQCAAIMHMSRGAIMGKVHRLGLPCRNGQRRKPILTRADYLKSYRYRERLSA